MNKCTQNLLVPLDEEALIDVRRKRRADVGRRTELRVLAV